MSAVTKLMTPGGGGVALTPASSIASDVTVNVPSENCTLGIQGPAFSAYQNSAQGAISSGVFTKVTFDTEEFDTNSNFASSRFTPTVAGYYQIDSSVRVDGSITRQLMSLYKNGAEFKRGTDVAGASPASGVVSTLVYANGSTDYFEVYVYTQGGTPTITATGVSAVYFQGVLVRAA